MPTLAESNALLRKEIRHHRRVQEELESLFNLDSKLVKSLVPLIVRPGLLTRAYLDGKRASYILPLRIYLLMSVVLFIGFSLPPPKVENTNLVIGGVLVSSAQEATPAEEQSRDSGAADSDPSPRRTRTSLELMTFSGDSSLSRFLNETFKDKQEELRKMGPAVVIELFFSVGKTLNTIKHRRGTLAEAYLHKGVCLGVEDAQRVQ